jgi:hypothetical protein
VAEATDGSGRPSCTRVNVSVPIELLERIRAEHPSLNLSAVFQDGLRALVECPHEHLACARCGANLRHSAVAEEALGRFYIDLISALRKHIQREGTAEGFGRQMKALGEEHGVRLASELPLPTLTRIERHAAKVKEFPAQAATPKAVGR